MIYGAHPKIRSSSTASVWVLLATLISLWPATCLRAESQARPAEALPLPHRSLAMQKISFTKDHPGAALTIHNLAGLYMNLRDYQQVLPLHKKALAQVHRHDPTTRVAALRYVITAKRLPILPSTLGAPPLTRQIEHDGAALRTAQLKFIRRGGGRSVLAHPYYWAPFVLMGDWR